MEKKEGDKFIMLVEREERKKKGRREIEVINEAGGEDGRTGQ